MGKISIKNDYLSLARISIQSNASNLRIKKIAFAVIATLCTTNVFASDSWNKEYVISKDVNWEDYILETGGSRLRKIHAGEKVTIINDATLSFNFMEDVDISGSASIIYGVDMEQPIEPGVYFSGPVLVTGGTLDTIGDSKSKTYAIWNYYDYAPDIKLLDTNVKIRNYEMGFKFDNGTLEIKNSNPKYVEISSTKVGIWTAGQASANFIGGSINMDDVLYGINSTDQSHLLIKELKNLEIKNFTSNAIYLGVNASAEISGDSLFFQGSNNQQSIAFNLSKFASLGLKFEKITLDNVGCGINSYGGSNFNATNGDLTIKNSLYAINANSKATVTINVNKVQSETSAFFVASGTDATVNLNAQELRIKSPIVAGVEGNSTVTLTAEGSSEIYGSLNANGYVDEQTLTSPTINLNLSDSSYTNSKSSYPHQFFGEAIAANKGTINLNLGRASYWEGRSDDFKDADSTDWKAAHEGEFSNLIPNLQSSGRVNVTLGDGAYWNVTGQSWVSKLDGNGTIDLRGSETGGYAIHIGEITGSNTFLVNLSKDNKDQSDMIYVYDGSGAAEQHVVISNRDEVLNGMKVGERVRFATVANASGGFVSEGMETEIAAGAAKTFGRSTQIRDAGVKNVNFKVVYEPYNTDQTTSEEDLGYNGGEGFDAVKPGNDYVETIYSQGENPYNVYIQRDEDIAEVTDPDDPAQSVTDAGRTIIDHARANYANAVQLDTLNKRQGEMRFSQGHEDGLWARIRHDDIGKRSSFRLDNTMVEVGVDSRYVKETGEFHTGVAFDYMNGDTDYHHISGEGDLDRYGVWFYTTWLGNEGDYTDFIIKCSLIDNEYKIYAPTTGEKITGDYDNNVISVSLEHGKKYSNEESWFIEPQAQLQYAYVTSAEYTNSQGTDVRLDGIHSLIGRVGVRAGKDVTRDNPFTFYARGDIMHEFMGKQDIKAKDATGTMRVRYENDDTWYSAGLGMSYLHNKDKYYYLEAEKVFGGSNTSSYIVSGGVRFMFD